MDRKALLGNALCVPVLFKHLTRPASPEDIHECASVAYAVARLMLRRADILLPVNDETPYVRIQYQNAPRPQLTWARHLSLYIQLQNGDNWMGRLSHLLPATRELWFAPRPDGTHPHLATDALRRNEVPRLSLLKLAVVFSDPPCRRQFILTH